MVTGNDKSQDGSADPEARAKPETEIEWKHTNATSGGRLVSLDALRGMDMLFLVGIAPILQALPQLSDSPILRSLADQCRHPEWQGFTLCDLIFPLFIFIVGAAMPFSLGKRLQRDGKWAVYRHVAVRAVILSVLGLVFWGTSGGVHPTWGYYSVLYRIAVSYSLAALIMLNFKASGQALWAFGLIAGYWVVMRFVSVPGYGAGDFSQEGALSTFLSQWISDNISPRLMYVFSITLIPSVANDLLGALAGQWLQSDKSPNAKTLGLLLAGGALVGAGFLAAESFPLNKKLASTSFTLLVCGLSSLLLGLFYWIIDVRGYRRWAFVFVVVGMNSITIYLAARYIDFKKLAGVFVGELSEPLGTAYPVALACAAAIMQWLFLYYLYKRKVFIKV
jgi:predicted acyltransferase